MRLKWPLLFLVPAAAAAALLLLSSTSREQEPSYQGKTLSQWLRTYQDSRHKDQRAADAVHHIGTNALPYLLKWVDYEMPTWRQDLLRVTAGPAYALGGFRLVGLLSGEKQVRANLGLAGFEILKEEASSAVPQLSRKLGRWKLTNTSHSTLTALMFVGKDGLPTLITVLTNNSNPQWVRVSAAAKIGAPGMTLGTNAAWMVPILANCLKDNQVAWLAAQALGAIRLRPEIAVPALVESLEGKGGADLVIQINCAESLGSFGIEATAAVPALKAATTSTNAVLRQNATNALLMISPHVLDNPGH
jgi:hypothetical protein